MVENEKKEDTNETSKEDIGTTKYFFERVKEAKINLYDKITLDVDNPGHTRACEQNVIKALKTNPILKLLVGALKKAGCPINLKRHIVCESCDPLVMGGYDAETNQIIICKNIERARRHPEAILVHELIHMYDFCVNKVDFNNMEHLACAEIRAANLAHCSFLESFLMAQSTFLNIKNSHQYCVKQKAALSLKAARNIDFPTAAKYILKVFDKCYNDLEPIGRRVRRNSLDSYLAEIESKNFKVCDP